MMRAAAILTFLGLLLVPARADAQSNSLSNYMGPQETAMGEGMRAAAVGALATTLNPAGLSLNKQLVFHGSYGFRPTDDASIATVAACDSTVLVPGCFYYNYLSSTPDIGDGDAKRRTHQFGVTASRALTQSVLVGVNTKYFDIDSDLTGEESTSGFAMDAGLIVRAGERVNLAAVGYNLIAKDSAEYPRAMAFGIALRPVESLSVVFDSRWDIESEAQEMKGARFGGLWICRCHGCPCALPRGWT